MNEIYENYLETSAAGTEESSWKIEEIKVNYSKYFPVDKNACCLDIGIGNGEMLHLLQDSGYVNAEGADISPSTIKRCSDRGYRCSLVENTVDFLKKYPGKFSMISMFHVIEHISREEILPIITACYEALRDDGVLLLETPNMANIDGAFMRYSDFSHVMGYTNLSLKQLLLLGKFTSFEIFSPNVIFRKSFKQKIWKLANKLQNVIFRTERKVGGVQLPSPTGIWLSAVACKTSK